VDVTGQFLPAGIVLHNDAFESSPKEVAGAIIAAIEPNAIADAKPLHGPAQVGFRGFEHQMKMIVHEHVGMDSRAEAFGLLGEQFQEMEPVGVVLEDVSAFVAAGGDVITSAGPFDA